MAEQHVAMNVQEGGFRSNGLDAENAPKTDNFSSWSEEDKKAHRSAMREQAAVPRTERPTIKHGDQLAPNAIVPDANLPYHPSPTFDPALLTHIASWNDHAAYVPGATAALTSAHEALTNINDAYHLLASDPAKMPPEQRLAKIAESAAKRHDVVFAALGKSVQDIRTGMTRLEDELDKPYTDKGATSLSAEMRALVRSKPKAEREEFIQQAIKNGNEAVLGAVLGVDPTFSEVDPLLHKKWRQELAAKRNPQLVARIAVMKRAAETLGRAQVALSQEFERSMRGSWATARRVEAFNNESATALAKIRGERVL